MSGGETDVAHALSAIKQAVRAARGDQQTMAGVCDHLAAQAAAQAERLERGLAAIERALDQRGPWFTSRARCLACGKRWAAVYAAPPERFECPACGAMEGMRDDGEDAP